MDFRHALALLVQRALSDRMVHIHLCHVQYSDRLADEKLPQAPLGDIMAITSIKILPVCVLLAALALSLVAGLSSRRYLRGGYGIEGRPMGHSGIGAAIASNWMSAASFLGIAGIFFVKGYFAFAYVLGWTGGYVLLLVLMGGQLRRFG